MIEKSNKRYPSAGIMAVVLICLMYSFGTFGFLNLFGARSIIQAVLLGFVTLLFISMRFKFRLVDFLVFSIFSVVYVVGSFVYWGQAGSLIDAYILVFCVILFFYVPPDHIIYFSKVLVFFNYNSMSVGCYSFYLLPNLSWGDLKSEHSYL